MLYAVLKLKFCMGGRFCSLDQLYKCVVEISGVKSTRKLHSSKSFVTDKKTTRSRVQSTDQKKYLSKSKKVVI